MLHITSYWKNAFQSFMSTPGFEYRPKQIKSSKIANIKKSPLNADNICNIEVMVIKKKSNKRTADRRREGRVLPCRRWFSNGVVPIQIRFGGENLVRNNKRQVKDVER